jgi:hypothetical protein
VIGINDNADQLIDVSLRLSNKNICSNYRTPLPICLESWERNGGMEYLPKLH